MNKRFAVLVAFALCVPSVAHATPTDEAERSEMRTVHWLMPGPYVGYATWPQTYLPDGLPECGDGGVQIDVYKYGTPEVRAHVDALLATGVLNGPEEDTRVRTPEPMYSFVELEPCPVAPVPTGSALPVGTDTTLGGAAPLAVAASAVTAAPHYTG